MTSMNLQATGEILRAAEHLPWGATLVIPQVAWDDYEYLLDELAEGPHLIIGKRTIDLESDPPPDIVVEIDTTRDSARKFAIYAALAVPEIWTYDGKNVQFYELRESRYVPILESRFLPQLTSQMLSEAIEVSKTRGQKTALDEFRRRIDSRKE